MNVLVWLGQLPPVRSQRWLDGALTAASTLGVTTAVAAGDTSWLDIVDTRAARAGVASIGIVTELRVDYLGWAQVAAAAARKVGARVILVDEASRPERLAECAAIADLMDAAQVTRVVAVASEGDEIVATRLAGSETQTLRVRGPAVLGVRIADAAVAAPAAVVPSAQRFDLRALGLDPAVLGHRSVPLRGAAPFPRSLDGTVDQLALFCAPRGR